MTYREVYHLIWDRPHKRRNGVLGAWCEIKRQMWLDHVQGCGQDRHIPQPTLDPADFIG